MSIANLLIFTWTALMATASPKIVNLRGQIFRRDFGLFIIKEYGAIQPVYRLKFASNVDTSHICLANVRPNCPYYEITVESVRNLGTIAEFRGVHITGFSHERKP